MRLSWIIEVGPKSNDKCNKRKTEGHRHRDKEEVR